MLRRIVRGVAEAVLVRLPSQVGAGDRLVLAYHNVVPRSWTGGGDASLHLPQDRFEQQLDILQREMEVVSLTELLASASSGGPRVAITFDDAYASALELGVAACVARGLPCTVFVAPALLGTVPVWDRRAAAGRWSDAHRQSFLRDEQGRGSEPEPSGDHPLLRIATADAIRRCSEASGPLVTFGNHTSTHPNLGALSTAEVSGELATCDRWLAEHVAGRRMSVVAYPYGIAPAKPEAVVPGNAAQYGMLVSGGWMRAGASHAPHALPRWNVPAGISLRGFQLRLRGRLLGG